MRTYQVLRRFVADEWGGIETVVLSLSGALCDHGAETEILCTSALSRPGEETFSGLKVRRLPYSYLRFPLLPRDRLALDRKGGNPFVPGLARAIVEDRGLSLVACHTMARMGGAVRAACRLRGIPYVVTLHGGHFHIPGGEQEVLRAPTRRSVDLGRPLDLALGTRRLLDDAAAILCLGREELESTRRTHPHVPSHALPNGVDVARFEAATADDARALRLRRGIPLDARLVLCVARIDPQKGQDVLLRAIAALGRPDVHVALVGPVTVAGFDQSLRGIAEEAGLTGRVHRLGSLRFSDPDLAAVYRAADVFALPSRHEPFGIVLLEAWAASRPVVASRVGGVPDFVTDGATGLLVPPEDPRALAAALGRALSEPGLAESLAAAGHREARDRYDWRAVARRVLSIYDDAVRDHRR